VARKSAPLSPAASLFLRELEEYESGRLAMEKSHTPA
jgi:hypothetical protein